jgi:hypothetical protein
MNQIIALDVNRYLEENYYLLIQLFLTKVIYIKKNAIFWIAFFSENQINSSLFLTYFCFFVRF